VVEAMKAQRKLPSQDALRRLLDYDPATGLFVWKFREDGSPQWNAKHAGKAAFATIDSQGYHTGVLLNVRTRAHRVAWKYMTGDDPIGIDHINGQRADNRWANLREANDRENGRNTKIHANNTSGHSGVSRAHNRPAWRAQIHGPNGLEYIGYFKTKEEAIAARQSAERRYGYHENHGRRQ
jgi:hypothetical protein